MIYKTENKEVTQVEAKAKIDYDFSKWNGKKVIVYVKLGKFTEARVQGRCDAANEGQIIITGTGGNEFYLHTADMLPIKDTWLKNQGNRVEYVDIKLKKGTEVTLEKYS